MLTPGSLKISTRFYSVQVSGKSTDLFDLTPPKIRVEVRAKGKPLSKPVSASYGFDESTGDVQLRWSEADPKSIEANTIALMIVEKTDESQVTVHLVDVTSGREIEMSRLENVDFVVSDY